MFLQLRSTSRCRRLDLPTIWPSSEQFDMMNKSALAERWCEGYQAYERPFCQNKNADESWVSILETTNFSLRHKTHGAITNKPKPS